MTDVNYDTRLFQVAHARQGRHVEYISIAWTSLEAINLTLGFPIHLVAKVSMFRLPKIVFLPPLSRNFVHLSSRSKILIIN